MPSIEKLREVKMPSSKELGQKLIDAGLIKGNDLPNRVYEKFIMSIGGRKMNAPKFLMAWDGAKSDALTGVPGHKTVAHMTDGYFDDVISALVDDKAAAKETIELFHHSVLKDRTML